MSANSGNILEKIRRWINIIEKDIHILKLEWGGVKMPHVDPRIT